MKIDNIRHVKSALSKIIRELPSKGSVVITRDGRLCAVLMPFGEDTDLEAVALAQNKAFWRLFDDAAARAEREGWTPLSAL